MDKDIKHSLFHRQDKKSWQNRGSILLSVIILTLAVSTLLQFFIDDYTVKQMALTKTKQYYMAKTMENLAFTELQQLDLSGSIALQQSYTFNCGKVKAEIDTEKIILIMFLHDKKIVTHEYKRSDLSKLSS